MNKGDRKKWPGEQEALAFLAACDRDLAQAIRDWGPPPDRRTKPGFAALLAIIVGQQVSTKAAAAILARLKARLGRLTPRRFLDLDAAELREIGFSRAKIEYGRELARHFLTRRLSMAELARLDDEDAIARLIAIKGIGRWSAEVFLIFALGRSDVLPAQDLALMVAAQRLKALPQRPKPAELRALGESWRPHRSMAARLLWYFYRNAPALA